MLYKIIGDSCMDLTEELKLDPHFQMNSADPADRRLQGNG